MPQLRLVADVINNCVKNW